MAHSIRCVLMRGGTSKGVFLRNDDLPTNASSRERTILSIFGSPDRRQIDGLGGADPLTSKVAIIGEAPDGTDSHLSYTFGQVEIERPAIDYASPCGNIIAAVGAYAVYEKLVAPVAPVTKVRVFNTNLQRIITLEVPVANGGPVEEGNFAVPGVPGTGAKILVDLSNTGGGACGALLPTGNVKDSFALTGGGSIDVSLIDLANPHVYVRAKDVGLTGTETVAEINSNKPLLARLEDIRGLAAVKFGLVRHPVRAQHDSRVTPLLAMVAPPASYGDPVSGTRVSAADIDLTARMIFLEQAHSNYAATSIACTGVAAQLAGSIVNEVARPQALARGTLRIGHPVGIFETECCVDIVGGAIHVRRATLGRTARRLLEGQVFIRD